MQNESPITQADQYREILDGLVAQEELIPKMRVCNTRMARDSDVYCAAIKAMMFVAQQAEKQGREQGLREAAEVCYSKDDHDAILALIDKSGGAV